MLSSKAAAFSVDALLCDSQDSGQKSAPKNTNTTDNGKLNTLFYNRDSPDVEKFSKLQLFTGNIGSLQANNLYEYLYHAKHNTNMGLQTLNYSPIMFPSHDVMGSYVGNPLVLRNKNYNSAFKPYSQFSEDDQKPLDLRVLDHPSDNELSALSPEVDTASGNFKSSATDAINAQSEGYSQKRKKSTRSSLMKDQRAEIPTGSIITNSSVRAHTESTTDFMSTKPKEITKAFNETTYAINNYLNILPHKSLENMNININNSNIRSDDSPSCIGAIRACQTSGKVKSSLQSQKQRKKQFYSKNTKQSDGIRQRADPVEGSSISDSVIQDSELSTPLIDPEDLKEAKSSSTLSDSDRHFSRRRSSLTAATDSQLMICSDSSCDEQLDVVTPDEEEHYDNIEVELQQKSLWERFHQHQTEMIITKIGRRMFPVLRFRIKGLNPHKLYSICLEMIQVDENRYRYVYSSSHWGVAGPGESSVDDSAVYVHPDSPASGFYWMNSPSIAFDKLKLTNNRDGCQKGQICLHSMQKYQPRIWIEEYKGDSPQTEDERLVPASAPMAATTLQLFNNLKKSYIKGLSSFMDDAGDTTAQENKTEDMTKVKTATENSLDRSKATSYTFLETEFITVTAYQNQQITKLKIDSNPFAKGFRDIVKQKDSASSSSSSSRFKHTSYMPSQACSTPSNLTPNYGHLFSRVEQDCLSVVSPTVALQSPPAFVLHPNLFHSFNAPKYHHN